MPTKLYDKEQILDDCLAVFAKYGYEKTSTVMLAEEAGISRALLFHHFKSKKNLYLSIVDRCFEKGSNEMGFDNMLDQQNFFEAKEMISKLKFNYYKENPDIYKVVMEAFYKTPVVLKLDIEARYGEMINSRDKIMRQLFNKVPLREGVDRDQAFNLIKLTLDYFENKYLSELCDDKGVNETYLQSFIDERNSFLSMIRFGIED